MKTDLPFFTLLIMISFASINAVLFTPALPDIANFFSISSGVAQQTITWFLIGYAGGQLIYGPIANRFGRKNALYMGVSLQIVSSLLCVFAGFIHLYSLLVLGRFLLALGSGVGLKMTFTLVNECYEPKLASQKISYLMLAFAITPGLGVALGGVLNENYGWTSCFYAGAVYGLLLLILIKRLPTMHEVIDMNAFKVGHLLQNYSAQFRNIHLLLGGLLMGAGTCFVYVFATLAPFMAIELSGMSSAEYGVANLLPPIGLILGSLTSAKLVKKMPLNQIIFVGISIACIGVVMMMLAMRLNLSVLYSLFFPMIIIYFGLTFILANASTLAMSYVVDKAHGSAVMNFINMGLATIVVFAISYLSLNNMILPIVYLLLCGGMAIMYKVLKKVS